MITTSSCGGQTSETAWADGASDGTAGFLSRRRLNKAHASKSEDASARAVTRARAQRAHSNGKAHEASPLRSFAGATPMRAPPEAGCTHLGAAHTQSKGGCASPSILRALRCVTANVVCRKGGERRGSEDEGTKGGKSRTEASLAWTKGGRTEPRRALT